MQEAVTRQIWHSDDTAGVVNQSFDGAGQGGSRPTGKVYSPEEAIIIQKALDAYTSGAAYSAFMDDRVGTLEIGKEADLAVPSQDIFAVATDAIGRTVVLTTWVGGKIVYQRAP